MAGPSEKNPQTSEQKPKLSSLLFYPPNELKHAIEAVSHANPERMSIMEVMPNRVTILCLMPVDSGLCFLDLNSGKVMDMILKNPFKKIVPLKEIFNSLDGSDDKIIEIDHADGSEELTITIEEGEKSVTVLGEVDDGSRVMDPIINQIIEPVSISKQDMMKIIQQVEADESTPVVFEMLNGTVSIKVEQEELTSFKYEENDANRGITHARFQFVQCECLKKALVIAEDVLLCLGTDPRVLTLRFNLGELGDIVYIIIESIDPSVQKPLDSSIAETSKKNPETSRDSSMAEPAQDQSIGDPSKENPETSLQKPEPPKQNPETPNQNLQKKSSKSWKRLWNCFKDSSIAESSKRISGDLLKENPESSNQKPTNSFSFEIRPAAKLKHAIEALSNVPTHGRVTFEVRENGMKIIASDESMNFVCYLYLKAGDLINFEYNQPFNKWVDIEQILNIFGVSEDGDKIQIHHVDGSNCLNFIFVMFEIADGTVSIKVEEQARTYYEHKESIATRGLKYSARFRFAHCEFLRKALSTAEGVLLFLATKPPDSNSLIVSFNHGELEELMCMYLFDDLEKINHYSFSLQIHPASKLKYAIDALRHANNSGTGIIEVGANGMKILCGDDEKPQTICICYLDFKAGSLINFKYNKHFKKLVRFEQIVQTLNGSNEGDIITIQHIDGSDKLSFMIGKLPCEDVPVLAANIAREVFPDMNQKLAFFIDWEHMRKIIQQPVLFEMLGGTVSIKVGEQLLTRFKYRENNANSGMNPYVRFQFVHHEFLEKALLVAEEVLLCLGVHPRGSPDILRLRFNLGELGDLVYVEEA